MFQWLWTAVWSAVMLPLGAALIVGRVPPWMRRQSTPGGLKVKGIAAFVLYAGLMVPPLTTLSGMRPEDADLVRMVLVPMAVFSGHGLVLGATLCERFNRRAMERAGLPDLSATSANGLPEHRGSAR
ncbi:hypothetical protein [Streptomyces sp. WMMC940]|uniref:hypothetical protein n=1 Tax=Streptomyces sp. WMMC940 TaxID=3015153 RepID=UPI0022B6E34C|nr:hypothetical protein [Streptomyces sp. WMMC940]MCZ7461989.1 hypothetical protein [Streptomyces sp. WMMC940]